MTKTKNGSSQIKPGDMKVLKDLKSETAANFMQLVTLHALRLSEYLGVHSDSLKGTLAEVASSYRLDSSYAKVASEYEQGLANEKLSKREHVLFYIH